jgi:hypothetical protein
MFWSFVEWLKKLLQLLLIKLKLRRPIETAEDIDVEVK